MDTAAGTENVREGRNTAIVKKVMSRGSSLTHGYVLLHQTQKEFNSCDLAGGKFK
jgi:hypothetical protein